MAILRRDLCKTLLAAPFALQAKDPPSNILFILSDDHSYPYLGVYGATWMSTPNLDQFAREGMLMDISSQGPTPQLFRPVPGQGSRRARSLGPGRRPRGPGQNQVAAAFADMPGVRDDLSRYCGEIERADRSCADAMAVLRKITDYDFVPPVLNEAGPRPAARKN